MPSVDLPPRSTPEQVRMLVGRHAQHLPRAGDEVERPHVVGRQPDAAHQRADSTSGQVADDPDARCRAAQRRQAVRSGRVEHLLPGRTGADACRSTGHVDHAAGQARGLHQDRCRRRPAAPRGRWPARPPCRPRVGGEAHDGRDVRRAGREHHRARLHAHGDVPRRGPLVAALTGKRDGRADVLAQRGQGIVDGVVRRCRSWSSQVPSLRM